MKELISILLVKFNRSLTLLSTFSVKKKHFLFPNLDHKGRLPQDKGRQAWAGPCPQGGRRTEDDACTREPSGWSCCRTWLLFKEIILTWCRATSVGPQQGETWWCRGKRKTLRQWRHLGLRPGNLSWLLWIHIFNRRRVLWASLAMSWGRTRYWRLSWWRLRTVIRLVVSSISWWVIIVVRAVRAEVGNDCVLFIIIECTLSFSYEDDNDEADD